VLNLTTALKAKLKSQKGAFSPFMFGMLMGVSIFSAVVMQWAQQDLLRLQKERLQRQKEQAQSVKTALELAVLTETAATYNEDLDLERALEFLPTSDKTRGGNKIQITKRSTDEGFGLEGERLIITTSDDEMLRQEVDTLGTAESILEYEGVEDNPVSVVDSTSLRLQQIERSKEYMEQEASQIYMFYASNKPHRFPFQNEYNDINATTGLGDVWGNPFNYTRLSDDEATLEFITPWGHAEKITLTLD